MPKFFPSFFLGRKENGLSTHVVEADRTNKEKVIMSPDGKRKYTIALFYQYGDPKQPIQSVRLSAMTDMFGGWSNILTIERSHREDGTYAYIYLHIPTGVANGATHGVEGGYDGDGQLNVNIDHPRIRWFLRGPDTVEADLLFKLHELPPRINMIKTLEAFSEQFHNAEKINDMKYFERPILFPKIEGDITVEFQPKITP